MSFLYVYNVCCTVDLQSVRIFHGSVWFVRAIGNRQNLWHGQTIRFHEIFERSVNPLYSGFTERTVDLQSVRIFHGSVWFVRAIGNRQNLWHGQTIRFHENIRTLCKSTVQWIYRAFEYFMEAYGLSVP